MMDPLAILGAALTSARKVHHLLSALHDGSKGVDRLANDIEQLRHVLEQLSKRPIVNETDGVEIADLARKCATDIASFESRLQRMQLSRADCRRARLWRRIHITLSEKDLEQMRDVIKSHVLILSFRLSLLQTTQLSLSTTQTSEILDLLQQLKSDVSILHPLRTPNNHSLTSPSNSKLAEIERKDKSPHAVDSPFEETVSRLMQLVSEKECTVDSEEATQLITDLGFLVRFAQNGEPMPHPGIVETNLRKYQSQEREEHVSKDLKLVGDLISSASSVVINYNGQVAALCAIPQGTIVEQTRKHKAIDLGNGVLTVSTVKRRRRQFGDEHERSSHKGHKDFVAKLIFKPNNAQTIVALSVGQAQVAFGSFSMAPHVSIINVLPRDSAVFQLAADGKVQDLMMLVAEGKASLRDHDTWGWSLLHHAIRHPTMCQFLIQNGLDVDEIAFFRGRTCCSEMITPLHLIANQGLHTTSRVLLEASADPSVSIQDSTGYSVFPIAFQASVAKHESILRQIFTIGHCFQVTDLRISNGRSVFLKTCCPCLNLNSDSAGLYLDSEQKIRTLGFLLDRGCSIHDTDHQGLNCLHLALSIYPLTPGHEHWRQALILIYLIRRGADPRATTALGWSISDMAYGGACSPDCPRDVKIGSCLGDLWDAVLCACGYDLREFRQRYPRKALYVERYTRQDFELLWKGHEHICPYWDDEIWPILDGEIEEEFRNESRVKKCFCWHYTDT